MIIRCPHCDFSRTVDENKIPASARTATCPKCHHKFRFRDSAGATLDAAEAGPMPLQQPSENHAPAAEQGQARDDPHGVLHKSFGAGADQAGSAPESGEDIWDRVASLGEIWLEDDDSGQDSQDSAKGGHHRDTPPDALGGAPWEHIRQLGLFKAFVQTALQATLHPRRFFNGLGAPRLLGLALVFYIVVTALQTYLFQAWMQLFPASALGLDIPPDYALYDSTQPLHIILAAPVVWVIFLFMVSVISAMAMRLLGGSRVSPAAVMRVMAYSASPMLLGVLPFMGAILGQAWAMVLFLLGCKHAFRLNLFAAIAVILPVYLCLTVLKIILSGSF